MFYINLEHRGSSNFLFWGCGSPNSRI